MTQRLTLRIHTVLSALNSTVTASLSRRSDVPTCAMMDSCVSLICRTRAYRKCYKRAAAAAAAVSAVVVVDSQVGASEDFRQSASTKNTHLATYLLLNSMVQTTTEEATNHTNHPFHPPGAPLHSPTIPTPIQPPLIPHNARVRFAPAHLTLTLQKRTNKWKENQPQKEHTGHRRFCQKCIETAFCLHESRPLPSGLPPAPTSFLRESRYASSPCATAS